MYILMTNKTSYYLQTFVCLFTAILPARAIAWSN